MALHADLYAWLKANSAIASAMKGGVHHEYIPQSEGRRPVLVFRLSSDNELEPDQDSHNSENVLRARYQFDVFGKESAKVIDAMDVLVAQLKTLPGTVGSTVIQSVERESMSDLGERDGDKRIARRSADFSINYEA